MVYLSSVDDYVYYSDNADEIYANVNCMLGSDTIDFSGFSSKVLVNFSSNSASIYNQL